MINQIDNALMANANAKLPTIDAKNEKALREQTDQFESVIIKMLLDNTMKDENNIFSSQDPGEKIYKSMYRDQLARSSAGSFGFSDMLFNYLSGRR